MPVPRCRSSPIFFRTLTKTENAMTFNAIEYINTPRWLTSRLGLDRTRELLERLGRPQDRLKFVHVAGTNGKGSTCAFLSSILVAAGYKTGLFTSPYIETFYERIRVNGENITDDELTRATLPVRDAAEAMEAEGGEHPTEFELMFAVALVHFARVKCDIVVLEVGLGGRLDSTNAIDAPEVAVIASIALDHTNLLGDTIAQIAHEKAGIIKSGASVVSWPQEPDAMAVVRAKAQEEGCDVRIPDFDALPVGEVGLAACDGGARDSRIARRPFTYKGRGFTTRLLGTYQPFNAALAIEAARALADRGWAVPEAAIARGIAETVWPARFELIAQPRGVARVVVDGGHNPQGAGVLADSLRDVFPDERPVFLMGVLADKDYRRMIAAVAPLGRAFVCATPPNPRALAAGDLADAVRDALACVRAANRCDADDVPVEVASGFDDAVARARRLAGADGLICAFGSLYSVADVKAAFSRR